MKILTIGTHGPPPHPKSVRGKKIKVQNNGEIWTLLLS